MALQLNYPVSANTTETQIQFSLRARELVRLLHNFGGRWMEGLTQEEYDNGMDADRAGMAGVPGQKLKLSNNLKTRWPYKPVITQAEYRKWLNDENEPLTRLVESDISELTRSLEQDPTYDRDIDLDNLEANP